jgi:hypothetical protein
VFGKIVPTFQLTVGWVVLYVVVEGLEVFCGQIGERLEIFHHTYATITTIGNDDM